MWQDRGDPRREMENNHQVFTSGRGEEGRSRAKLCYEYCVDGPRRTARAIHTVLLTILITTILISSCLVISVSAEARNLSDDNMAPLVDMDQGGSSVLNGQLSGEPSSNIPEYQETMRFFIENKGQFDNDVRFVAVTEFGKAVFYDSKVEYLLERYENGNLSGVDVITLTFPVSDEVTPQGQELLPHYTNYFIGDPSRWVSGAQNYGSIVYQDLWPGIDLIYKFSQIGLKYEFIVDPYISEQRIGIHVEGAKIYCEPHHLIFDTGYGCLVDGDLLVSQEGDLKGLASDFITNDDVIAFLVEGRDISKSLLIDPLLYSTYIGGSAYDFSQSISVDGNGNAYVTGQTQSANFPTSSSFQVGLAGGNDAFVLKLDASGKSLIYSTFIGGSGGDYGQDIVIDASGNAYVIGSTTSTDFPTSSPIQAVYGGGSYDAFVLKLDPTGKALIYSTYLGGSGEDVGNAIDIDVNGNAYVTGYTNSTNFPTVSALQPANGGSYDAFVLKLNASGKALVYSTYLGGSDTDYGQGIVVDANGNAYVSGTTYSTNFPTNNPYQAIKSGSSDIFVLKLNAAGGAVIFSTYIGGVLADYGQGITLDTSGNVYVSGYTDSNNFPTSPGAFRTTNAGNGDVFVLKLNPTGNALIYSTYIGGSDDDVSLDLSVDAVGNAYVTGYTNSTDFPIAHPFQARNSGAYDAFVLRLNPTGTDLGLSTFLGGNETDAGYGIALDDIGNAYITGGTYSTDFPIIGPFQAHNSGDCDGFILKFNLAGSALLFSTYVGGTGEDQGQAITLDDSGNVYLTGYTYSTDFPLSSGSFHRNNTGGADVFVLKLNPSGSTILYSTYIGGSDDDLGVDIVVDAGGNAYVTGYTLSSDFPTTYSVQATNGGGYDAFALKLNPSGGALLYSTYIGGSDTDYGQGIAIDANGNAYVTGGTYSTNFPTAYPLRASNSGSCDAFVLKLNIAGNALLYSTYIGGSWDDQGLDLAVDGIGNAYVTGSTNSTNFLTFGPLQVANGGSFDAFVLKLNPTGGALLYSTYIGGSEYDQGRGIAVDALGDVYVTGDTNSTNFPTLGPFQAMKGNFSDVFVLKLDWKGSVLLYSTYIGGNDDDVGYSLALDDEGNAYVTGYSYSTDFPTFGPLQGTEAGDSDAFVLELDRHGDVLIYSTYMGGSDTDFALSIAIDASGNAYVIGSTYSTNFPTSHALQAGNGGLTDAFVLKLGSLTVPSAPLDLAATPGNGQVTLTWSAPINNGGYPIDYYVVFRNGTDIAHPGSISITITGLTNGITYSFMVAAHNTVGVGALTTAAIATPSAQTMIPGVPTDLVVTVGDSKVTLSWGQPDNGGTGIDYYIIYRNGEDVKHSTDLNAEVDGLTNGVEYSFTVAAHNAAGTGPVTAAELATPKTSSSGGSGDMGLLIISGIVAAVVGAVLIAIFALKGRRRNEAPPVKPPESAPPPVTTSPVPPPMVAPPPVEEPKFCPWCGEQSGDEFCPNCGRKQT